MFITSERQDNAHSKIKEIYNLENQKKHISLDDLRKSFDKREKVNTLTHVPLTAYTKQLDSKNRDCLTKELRPIYDDQKQEHSDLLKRYIKDIDSGKKLQYLAKDIVQKGYMNQSQAYLDDCFVDVENCCLVKEGIGDILSNFKLRHFEDTNDNQNSDEEYENELKRLRGEFDEVPGKFSLEQHGDEEVEENQDDFEQLVSDEIKKLDKQDRKEKAQKLAQRKKNQFLMGNKNLSKKFLKSKKL